MIQMKNEKLIFPKDKYRLETRTVKTEKGEVEIVCRHYDHIVYVSDPIDPEFQSMNVDVPVRINSKDIDASIAPILIAVRVGAYMQTGCGGRPVSFMSDDPGAKPPVMGSNGFGGPGGLGNRPPPKKKEDRILGLALAAGFVLVSPGNRGRGNIDGNGKRFGKAPATIVDLKSAIRYIRHNRDVFPGNTEHIVTNGLSAGGAMSALLGASGNSELYNEYFAKVGAAAERDDVFAVGAFCPMCDLDHADMAYEWMLGSYPNSRSGLYENQEISAALAAQFPAYQASLGLVGHNGEALTADNYGDYLANEYLIPSANSFLKAMPDEKREEYLAEKAWIAWDGESAHFTMRDLNKYAGRLKPAPAFDNPQQSGEGRVFGSENEEFAHFTDFSAHRDGEEVRGDVKKQARLMNPMPFILEGNPGCAKNWWIRLGTLDNGMSFSVSCNLATALENKGCSVNYKFYWDAGHYEDLDPEDFVRWVNELTGYRI